MIAPVEAKFWPAKVRPNFCLACTTLDFFGFYNCPALDPELNLSVMLCCKTEEQINITQNPPSFTTRETMNKQIFSTSIVLSKTPFQKCF